jgi:hypothetical protein
VERALAKMRCQIQWLLKRHICPTARQAARTECNAIGSQTIKSTSVQSSKKI